MKKHIDRLHRDWRKFDTVDKPKEDNIKVDAPIVNDVKPTDTAINAQQLNKGRFINPELSVNKANNLGGVKPLGLGKLKGNPNALSERFNNNIKANSKSLKTVNNMHDNEEEYEKMMDVLTRAQKRRVEDFQDAIHYDEMSEYPAPASSLTRDGVKNRRLAVELSRVISKLAEDHVGATTEGDDFWDCDRLVRRQFNKESIYNCRNSREKQNIVIMLDSSPSCKEESQFYSDIATQICRFGDVELYNAPNGRLVKIYSNKEKRFVPFLTMEDVIKDMHKLSAFKNRVIIFFGDCDGFRIMAEASVNNIVYYFNSSHIDDIDYYISQYGDRFNGKRNNFNVMPDIINIKSFMEACKKLK